VAHTTVSAFMEHSPRDRDVEVARQLWRAIRARCPAEAEALLHEEVEWFPALLADEPLRGRAAVRRQLQRITAPDPVEDFQPRSFEPVGQGCVVVGAALRLRRADGGVTTLNRWWVYRVLDGRIVYAANLASRASALDAARRAAN
jgi:ketosteroid isomerase-like protein